MFFHTLTKIRNANIARKFRVFIRKTTLTLSIVNILKEEGFIHSFEVFSDDKSSDFISIFLKYKGLKQIPYMTGLVRVSKPGFRVYVEKTRVPKVLGGIGIAICLHFLFLSNFKFF